MKKIFFFDVDGTLLPHGNNEKLSPKTIYALNELRKNGYDVILATGKSKQMINKELTELNIHDYITCNGAVITKDDNIIFTDAIKKSELEEIINFCKVNDFMLGVQTNDYYHMLDLETTQINYGECFQSINLDVPQFSSLKGDELFQAWVIGEEVAKYADKQIIKDYKQMQWHKFAFDIISKKVSKKSAIQHYINKYYDEEVEIYCFGDGNNDIEMIEYADNGIVMGNGTDRLKKYANEIIKSCEEDGVYHYLVNQRLIQEQDV